MTSIWTAPFEPGISSATSLDIIQRNASGVWVNRQPVGTETSQTINSAAANDTVPGNSLRLYAFVTMPTTAPYWDITGIEWKNGTVVNGSVMGLVELVDANPPAVTQTTLLAFTKPATQTGVSAVQRNSDITQIGQVRSGAIVGVAIWSSSATGRFLTSTVSSRNNSKAIAYSAVPAISNGTAWTASTEETYAKLYYKPVLGV